MAAPRYASRYSRRRRPVRALVVVLLLVGAAAYVLIDGGGANGQTAASPSGATAADGGRVVDELLDDVVENPDGSVTVTLSETQAATLVAAGLARSSAPALRDVSVDLVSADDGLPGRMIVSGRLARQPLPVRATVDLEIADASVRPRVRDVRIGPLGVPSSVRRDLDRQLQDLVGLVAQGVTVSELHTTDAALVLTGTRT